MLSDLNTLRQAIMVVALVGVLLPITPTARASTPRLINDFDGVETSWRLVRRSSGFQLLAHARTDQGPHSGLRCEHVAVQASRGGSRIHLTHVVPPSAAIDEFRASVWVRGNRPGFQLMARVRLPHTLDDRTGQSVSFFIRGEKYTDVGRWQQLSIGQIVDKIAVKTRVLRADPQVGRHFDASAPFVDRVVLNAYGGAGLNLLWMDDLEIVGSVPALATPLRHASHTSPRVQPVSFTAHARNPAAPSLLSIEGNKLRLRGGPFVPRVVTFQGEAFGFLKNRLGFNTIWLSQAANQQQLISAEEHGVWLICPPPDDLRDAPEKYQKVIAWSLGSAHSSIEVARTEAASIRAHDPLKRPIVGGDAGLSQSRSPIADVAIKSSAAPMRARGEVAWLSLDASNQVCWRQLQATVHAAIGTGISGFVFQSDSNLERPGSVRRRDWAELLNLELTVLQPWIGSESVASAPLTERTGDSPIILSNGHALLALLPVSPADSTSTTLWMNAPQHPYLLSIEPCGLTRVAHQRTAGGISVGPVAGEPMPSRVLITDSAVAVHDMAQKLKTSQARWNALLFDEAQAAWRDAEHRLEHSQVDSPARLRLREQLYDIRRGLEVEGTSAVDRKITCRQIQSILTQLERLMTNLDADAAR